MVDTIEHHDVPYRKWRFKAVDMDDMSINVRLNSTLNSAAVILTPRAVVEIELFIPIWFCYPDEDDMRCCIVIKKFKVVGHQLLKED